MQERRERRLSERLTTCEVTARMIGGWLATGQSSVPPPATGTSSHRMPDELKVPTTLKN